MFDFSEFPFVEIHFTGTGDGYEMYAVYDMLVPVLDDDGKRVLFAEVKDTDVRDEAHAIEVLKSAIVDQATCNGYPVEKLVFCDTDDDVVNALIDKYTEEHPDYVPY